MQTYNTPFGIASRTFNFDRYIGLLSDYQSALLYPPSLSKQFSRTGTTQVLDYKAPLIEDWPDRDMEQQPLSVIDIIEICLAYNCDIAQADMVKYIHMNR